MGKKKKWIKHYSSSHKILLVGEGDFSFSACLATAFGSAANMVATSLDSKEELEQKYSKAATHLKELKGRGCIIIHQVDAHTMSQHPLLHHNFDRVIFNFPHAGLPLQNENNRLQIKFHQEVVKGFLKSAREMVSNGGEIHVTHKTAHPFSRWEIDKLAEEVGLCLVETTKFTRCDYPGYINKRGYGRKCNKAFRVGECCTFKFVKVGFVYS